MKMVALAWTSTLLVLFSVAALAQERYVAQANEDLYGTWTSTGKSPQKIVFFSGGYRSYWSPEGTDPICTVKEEIVAKWTDSDGAVWYKTVDSPTQNDGRFIPSVDWSGSKVLVLQRISKEGTVLEYVARRLFSDYNPRIEVLMDIDSGDYSYHLYNRAEN
jgi:hypothetical protein